MGVFGTAQLRGAPAPCYSKMHCAALWCGAETAGSMLLSTAREEGLMELKKSGFTGFMLHCRDSLLQ